MFFGNKADTFQGQRDTGANSGRAHSRAEDFKRKIGKIFGYSGWSGGGTGHSFEEGIPGAKESPQTKGFQNESFIKKETENKEASINISELSETKFTTIKTERLTYSSKSPIYDKNGTYKETLSKGTSILIDTTKPIFSKKNPQTGRLEAYLAIDGYIYKDEKNAEFITTSPGYIRAGWLDSRISQNDEVKSQKVESPKMNYTMPPKKVGFDGYMGPNGKPIPPYILKAVTVHYLKKDILPKVESNIQSLQGTINETRGKIVKEVMEKGVSFKETEGYKTQIESLEKKGKVENFYKSLQSFTLNGSPVITDPNVEQVIASIQSTPKWQQIIQQAAHIDYQKRAGKI